MWLGRRRKWGLEQGFPTPGLWPTTGRWAFWAWATEVAGKGTHVHPFAWAAGERAHHSHKRSYAHSCHTQRAIPPPASLQSRNVSPTFLRNSGFRICNFVTGHCLTVCHRDILGQGVFFSPAGSGLFLSLIFLFTASFRTPNLVNMCYIFRVSCWCTDKSPEHFSL